MDEVSRGLEYNYARCMLDVDMASFKGFRAGAPRTITEFITGPQKTSGEGAVTMVERASEQALKLIKRSLRGKTKVNYPEYSLESDFGKNPYD